MKTIPVGTRIDPTLFARCHKYLISTSRYWPRSKSEVVSTLVKMAAESLNLPQISLQETLEICKLYDITPPKDLIDLAASEVSVKSEVLQKPLQTPAKEAREAEQEQLSERETWIRQKADEYREMLGLSEIDALTKATIKYEETFRKAR
jgi:hypothetical protein